MSPNRPLTPAQQRAVTLISAGSTAFSAAQAVGVHRNTVANWRRSPVFREALAQARAAEAKAWRDKTGDLASRGIDAIHTILFDPHTPAGVRLKAAIAIRAQVAGPAPAKASLPVPPPQSKPSRNQLCPCGSGKKFKRCCLTSR
jgi:hypothetical protein